jgi:hypothetical protein
MAKILSGSVTLYDPPPTEEAHGQPHTLEAIRIAAEV